MNETRRKAATEIRGRAIELVMDEQPLPVLGLRPRYTAMSTSAPTPMEQKLLHLGFEPLRGAEEYEISTHPNWTLRLSPEGLYELRYKGALQLRGNRPVPTPWSTMVRRIGAVLVVLQREAGRTVVDEELIAALQAGETLVVGARLVHCAQPGQH